ncbi:hypothetical protein [Azotobacter chroococcum]|uniref:Uncharacterized protein n=1 Tax=Azotobacter chroococcum TaxID=353 RepID=A0AAQ0C1F0_9GAMM|nr:hypothetical protein [Azotobacter chroococcum]QQE91019.1 hypothetical protein GKQ51_21530 [Azotobacter chroococcum]
MIWLSVLASLPIAMLMHMEELSAAPEMGGHERDMPGGQANTPVALASLSAIPEARPVPCGQVIDFY